MTEYVTIEKKLYEDLLKTVQEVPELRRRIEELEKRLWVYENPDVPPSKTRNKEKRDESKPQEKRGAPEGHLGATRK